MTRHGHGRAYPSIEPEWMNVREVPMRCTTRGPNLDGMAEGVMMANDIPRLGMTSRHMDPIDGNRDGKTRCDVVLRDLGPSRAKVEPNDLA